MPVLKFFVGLYSGMIVGAIIGLVLWQGNFEGLANLWYLL